MIEFNKDLLSGIVIGIILTFLLHQLYKKWKLSIKPRSMMLRVGTKLPTMNTLDLGCCIRELMLDPRENYILKDIKRDGNDITIWFDEIEPDGTVKHVSTSVTIDDNLPCKYPLSYYRKKKI